MDVDEGVGKPWSIQDPGVTLCVIQAGLGDLFVMAGGDGQNQVRVIMLQECIRAHRALSGYSRPSSLDAKGQPVQQQPTGGGGAPPPEGVQGV